jgi:mono/diheme cytochrome c family protein
MFAAGKAWVRTVGEQSTSSLPGKSTPLVAILFFLLSSHPTISIAQQVDERGLRGQALHDQICRGCHEDNMYTERHLSRNPYFDLRMQTRLWSEVVGVRWSEQEIDDVVFYLQENYYSDRASKQ